jgi:hypothetical protein
LNEKKSPFTSGKKKNPFWKLRATNFFYPIFIGFSVVVFMIFQNITFIGKAFFELEQTTPGFKILLLMYWLYFGAF